MHYHNISILALHKARWSTMAIAKELHISPAQVQQAINNFYTDLTWREYKVTQMYLRGVIITDICRYVGISKSYLYDTLNRLEIPTRQLMRELNNGN